MLADRDQILVEARQHLGLAVGHDHEVLDPDPAQALEVDARLDRGDVAGRSVSLDSRERRGASCTSSPTPWPRPWPKFSPKPAASILSRAAASASTPVTPGPRRREARQLALERRGVGGLELVRQRAGGEGARAVGVVAVDHRAGVDHDRLAGLDRAVGRPRVRLGGVRARGDDRLEGRRVGAVLVEELVQPPRELALGATDEALLGEARVGLARDLAGPADRVQLRRRPSPRATSRRGRACGTSASPPARSTSHDE